MWQRNRRLEFQGSSLYCNSLFLKNILLWAFYQWISNYSTMKIEGNVLFPIEGTICSLSYRYFFSFVISYHLICCKINIQFLRGITNLFRTLIHSRFLWETSKESQGAEGRVTFLFSLGGIFTAKSVVQSSVLLEEFSFRWNRKAKFCGYQRFPGPMIEGEHVCLIV